MHDHRNGGPPLALPEPGSPEWWAQRIVLAELVITPPLGGDTLGYLLEYVPLKPDAIELAIRALDAIGLAEQSGDLIRATPAAQSFEYLWPIRP